MRSIYWKLILTSMVVVFIPIYLLNQRAIQHFDEYTRQVQEEQMIDTASIFSDLFRSVLRPTPGQQALPREAKLPCGARLVPFVLLERLAQTVLLQIPNRLW